MMHMESPMAEVFTGFDLNGTPLAFSVTEPWWTGQQIAEGSTVHGVGRYKRISTSKMLDFDLYYSVGSARVWKSRLGDVNLLLFRPHSEGHPDFLGEFLQIGITQDDARDNFEVLSIPSFGAEHLRRYARSMLLVLTNTGDEVRHSLRTLFLEPERLLEGLPDALQGFLQGIELPSFNRLLDPLLPEGVRRDGDAVFEWAMWPERDGWLSPYLWYFMLEQRLRIDACTNIHSKIYAATIRFWVHLTLIGGEVTANVDFSSIWVEDGTLHRAIVKRLGPAVETGRQTLRDTINNSFRTFDPILRGGDDRPYRYLYYLPGNQVNPIIGIGEGNTDDDVTLVLEFGEEN
jgi:hypothetical protein